jgi:hypothetical protein
MNSPNLVVTRQSLLRKRLAMSLVCLGLIVFGWFIYELGLYNAGFMRMQTLEMQNQLNKELVALQARNKQLSEKLAVIEVAGKIDRQSYSQVEGELVALQGRILEQQEDIEFYKGIVNEDDGMGLRIQDFEISQGFGEREYDVHLVLAQAFRSDKKVSGKVDMVLEGVQRGKAARLELAELTPADSSAKSLAYSFRYFQDIKAAVVLPEDFVPERVHVIVTRKGNSSKTVEEFFIWNIKPG